MSDRTWFVVRCDPVLYFDADGTGPHEDAGVPVEILGPFDSEIEATTWAPIADCGWIYFVISMTSPVGWTQPKKDKDPNV